MESESKTESPLTDNEPECKTPDSDTAFEKLVNIIGGRGPFQVFVLSIAFGSKMTTSAVFLYMSFAGATPDFWCVSTGTGKDVNVSGDDSRWSVRNKTANDLYEACDVNGSACSAFVFDDSMTTIVNEWDLVCSKKWVSSTITTLQMVAVTVAAALIGQIADTWGRRKPCLLLLVGQFVFSLANAFSPNWIMFAITRMAAGFCAGGYMVPYATLSLEFIDKRWRILVGGIPTWAFGGGLMALAAWQLHEWQYLSIVIAAATVPFIVGWWFLPESARWLLVHNRTEEAQTILCRAARWNSRPPPDEEFVRQVALAERTTASSKNVFSILDIFRSWELAKRSCLLFSVWFSTGMLYYFLAFGAENLSGNLYVNIFILSALEAPSYMLSAFLNNRIGRRWTCFLFFLTAGISSSIVVLLIFTESSGLAVNGLVFLSKVALGGGGNAMMTFTSEIFPTAVRNIGYGGCSTASRVGSILAPQLVFLQTSHPSVPYVIAAVLMVGNSITFLLLPETNDMALKDMLPSTSLPTTPPGKSGTKTGDCQYVSISYQSAEDTAI